MYAGNKQREKGGGGGMVAKYLARRNISLYLYMVIVQILVVDLDDLSSNNNLLTVGLILSLKIDANLIAHCVTI